MAARFERLQRHFFCELRFSAEYFCHWRFPSSLTWRPLSLPPRGASLTERPYRLATRASTFCCRLGSSRSPSGRRPRPQHCTSARSIPARPRRQTLSGGLGRVPAEFGIEQTTAHFKRASFLLHFRLTVLFCFPFPAGQTLRFRRGQTRGPSVRPAPHFCNLPSWRSSWYVAAVLQQQLLSCI